MLLVEQITSRVRCVDIPDVNYDGVSFANTAPARLRTTKSMPMPLYMSSKTTNLCAKIVLLVLSPVTKSFKFLGEKGVWPGTTLSMRYVLYIGSSPL